jgi:hypothetical protein
LSFEIVSKAFGSGLCPNAAEFCDEGEELGPELSHDFAGQR